ncbi:MAG: Glu-tRNA(Gln) amidotransferase subunit GatD [Candidatus Parvarchaeota archaeon]|jgi:glutamyl-tRNA(Gln) amidotransferase subunit D|nr:Glu-tRNA(Gln) amidotransferase subunit GatD [Candidatus Parvarchaeota archaeon]MCL5106955.1 Glu-tRNA(Gln) amidotransferase subunit GatD [Candidatus Parvarchaeota archaeon]
MNSKRIETKNLSFGDVIEIKIDNQTFNGEFIKGEENLTVIKLKSGYDIAVPNDSIENITIIEKGRKPEEKEQKEERKNDKNPDITIITTGGTISSKIDYKTGGVSPSVDSDYYFQISPDLEKQGKIAVVNLMRKLSENMLPSDWIKIAKEAYSSIKNGSKGIIVTSGTDTMHFASSALSFLLNPLSVPVVFTGSQRSTDRGSTDASTNLLLSAFTAKNFPGGESVICMHANLNDEYNYVLRGNKARKMHTERRDAFRPINIKPLAKVYTDGKINELSSYIITKKENTRLNDRIDENVKLIYGYPSMGGDIINYYIDNKVHGMVISATGFGNLPLEDKTVVSALKKAEKEGVPIVITSQTIYGATNKFVYSTLREISGFDNIVYVGDMTTETAFVKLMFALGNSKKLEEVKEIMSRNLAGEIKERREIDEFLI